MAPWAVAIR